MTTTVWPQSVRQSSVDWRFVSNTEASIGPFSGQPQTVYRPGDRLACTVRVLNARTSLRAACRKLITELEGASGRIMLPDMAHQRRGSYSAGELFANADFSAGTNGWSASGGSSISVADQIMRTTVASVGSNPQVRQAVTLAAYTPYALRVALSEGRGLSGITIGPAMNDPGGITTATNYSATRGYLTTSLVTTAAGSGVLQVLIQPTSGYVAGAYFDMPFASASQCALADGGANLFLNSDDFANASWTPQNLTVVSNSVTAPDGTSTGDVLQENTASNVDHYIANTTSFTVSSAATTYMISCMVQASTRGWVMLRLRENTGSTTARAWFNVSTGVVGSTSPGANWSNVRAITPVNMGGGWYLCMMMARKTNAATSLDGFVHTATGDNVTNYAGAAGTNALRVWRAGLAVTEVPARVRQTTSSAVTAESQSSSGLHLKGLPASQSGLLLPGDPVEVDSQIKIVTAPLDTDAAGLGYLQFKPQLPRSIANNTPVFINEPMCKMIMMDEPVESAHPGGFSDFEFEFVQDLS